MKTWISITEKPQELLPHYLLNILKDSEWEARKIFRKKIKINEDIYGYNMIAYGLFPEFY